MYINQDKYYKELHNMFDMNKDKVVTTLMSTSRNLNKDEGGKPVEESR